MIVYLRCRPNRPATKKLKAIDVPHTHVQYHVAREFLPVTQPGEFSWAVLKRSGRIMWKASKP